MSSFLAPATVTATIAWLLERTAGRNEPGAVPDASVTTLSPGSDKMRTDRPGVNIFLFGVTPEPFRRNQELPVRRADGDLVQPTGSPLNLRYLVSFSGNEEQLEPQRLMGLCVSVLSATPVLSRPMMQEAVRLPQFADLGSSDLADTGDVVRLRMADLSLEQLSQLWSILSPAAYRLSVVYDATTVMVSDDRPLTTGIADSSTRMARPAPGR